MFYGRTHRRETLNVNVTGDYSPQGTFNLNLIPVWVSFIFGPGNVLQLENSTVQTTVPVVWSWVQVQ